MSESTLPDCSLLPGVTRVVVVVDADVAAARRHAFAAVLAGHVPRRARNVARVGAARRVPAHLPDRLRPASVPDRPLLRPRARARSWSQPRRSPTRDRRLRQDHGQARSTRREGPQGRPQTRPLRPLHRTYARALASIVNGRLVHKSILSSSYGLVYFVHASDLNSGGSCN